MPDISYDDKDKDTKDGVHNKWRDTDANEVKTVVNSKADRSEVADLANPFRGIIDIDVNAFVWPNTGGTFTAGKPGKGNWWEVNLSDPNSPPTIGGKIITQGSKIMSYQNDPHTGNPSVAAEAVRWRVENV